MSKKIKSAEVAAILGISKATLHKYEKEGKLSLSIRHPLTNYRIYEEDEVMAYKKSKNYAENK